MGIFIYIVRHNLQDQEVKFPILSKVLYKFSVGFPMWFGGHCIGCLYTYAQFYISHFSDYEVQGSEMRFLITRPF